MCHVLRLPRKVHTGMYEYKYSCTRVGEVHFRQIAKFEMD